ncbi:unnamed protein product [Alopecurus aequalis]
MALLVLSDLCSGAYFVYQLNLDHLFSGEPDEEFPPILSLPDPAASFNKQVYLYENRKVVHSENMSIAVSGNLMVAATARSRTLFYDAESRSTSTGPEMLSGKIGVLLVPVADGTFFALSLFPNLDPKGRPRAELLAKDADGRLAWQPVPDPPLMSIPRPSPGIEWHISAYFVAGTRVWVSFWRQGTFSFDTACGLWRMEGAWELPVKGRALLVPGFSGHKQLLFGFSSVDLHFCACDIEARPPVIIKTWPEAIPSQLARRAGYLADPRTVKLAYYGAGRFCISTVIVTGYFPQKLTNMDQVLNLPRHAVSVLAMEVTPGMRLIKHKLRCYSMPAEAPKESCHLLHCYSMPTQELP